MCPSRSKRRTLDRGGRGGALGKGTHRVPQGRHRVPPRGTGCSREAQGASECTWCSREAQCATGRRRVPHGGTAWTWEHKDLRGEPRPTFPLFKRKSERKEGPLAQLGPTRLHVNTRALWGSCSQASSESQCELWASREAQGAPGRRPEASLLQGGALKPPWSTLLKRCRVSVPCSLIRYCPGHTMASADSWSPGAHTWCL